MKDSRTYRILVLEDEPLILMDLSMALEELSVAAIGAVNPGAALAKIDGGRIDAAIPDVNLDCNATCEAVAKRLAGVGVPFPLHSGALVRQGDLIARIAAEVIVRSAPSDTMARCAVEVARGNGHT